MQVCRSCTLRPLVIESCLLFTIVVLNGISVGSRNKHCIRCYACYILCVWVTLINESVNYKSPWTGISDWLNNNYSNICMYIMLCDSCYLLSLFISRLPTALPKIAVLLLPLLSTYVLFKLLDGSLLFSTWPPPTFALLLNIVSIIAFCLDAELL